MSIEQRIVFLNYYGLHFSLNLSLQTNFLTFVCCLFLGLSIQARSQDLEKGGFFEFSLFLNQNYTVCPKIETEFLGKLGNSNVFSAQKQVVSKKKKRRSSPQLRRILRPKSDIQTFLQATSRHVLHNFGTQFPMGGDCFQFFTKNRLQKHQKRAILHTSQANGRAPPPPSPGYAIVSIVATVLGNLKKCL